MAAAEEAGKTAAEANKEPGAEADTERARLAFGKVGEMFFTEESKLKGKKYSIAQVALTGVRALLKASV